MDVGIEPVIQKPLDESLLARFKRPHTADEARETANQLEGVFLSMVLEKMRASLSEGGLFGDTPGADTYGSMFDQMMGEELSRRGGLGIAEMVLSSMAPAGVKAEPADVPTDGANSGRER